MFRIALPFDDSFLLLAPRCSGWGDVGQVVALATLLLAPLLLICCLYRYELKLVTRRCASALLLLRLLGVLILFALAGLQPAIGHVQQEESPSRVIVAIDLSASMDLADPQRTLAEREILARVFNVKSDAVDGLSRKQIVRRLLEPEALNLLELLKSQHQVELLGFHQSLSGGSEQSLAALLQPQDRSAGLPGTNVGLPLLRALQPNIQKPGKLLGVVVLSDGQHNHGPPPLEAAKELARRQTPIYPIAIGSLQPPIDLAVLDLQAPKQVFKDAEATVQVKLRASGLPAQDLIVELTGSGKFVKQQQIIQHDGKNRVYTPSFPIKLEEVGAQRLEFRVRPQKAETREMTIDNNRLATVVRVAAEKSRILIVEDEPRWEYHYLATALARDPDLALDRVLFTQPRTGATPEDQLEKLGHARRQLPPSDGAIEDPLWQYDCIVLGDVAPEQLPTIDRKRLERYVADRGGTLVVSAGKRFMPLAYFTGPADDPLLKLLPLREPLAVQPKDGFTFAVTDLGEKTSFFQIDANADASKQRWLEMPKHYSGVSGIAKPGAVVLARAESADLPRAKDGAADRTGLVLQQPYGFGKVLYLGLESTWRWRYRVGDTYHHRFWGQLMRWAVSDAWLPEGNRFVRYGAKAPIYRHDQEIELAARLGEEAPKITAGNARIKLIHKEGDKEEAIAAVPLLQDEQRARQWAGKIKQLPPGHYQLELDIPELRANLAALPPADKTAPSHGFTVLPPDEGELIDVATNWDLLRSLADQTGGRLFTVEDAEQLPPMFARQVERKETRRDERLWQDEPLVWWVLGTLLTLLTAEWVLRKFAGLP